MPCQSRIISRTQRAAFVCGALLHVLPSRAELPFEQHFSPAENLERIDVALIDSAAETIEMAAYVLTDVAVIEALDNAASRGVKVRIFRDSGDFDKGAVGAALATLERDGAEIRYKEPGRALMHLKAYCVDGLTFRFGAANLSASGLKRQNNDLDVTRGPGTCNAFEDAFKALWTE